MMSADNGQSENRLLLETVCGAERVKGAMVMTDREHDVCREMINAGDDAYEKTAAALGIETSTVKKHMKSVRMKIGFVSTMGVLIWLQRWYHLTDREAADHLPNGGGNQTGGVDRRRGPACTGDVT